MRRNRMRAYQRQDDGTLVMKTAFREGATGKLYVMIGSGQYYLIPTGETQELKGWPDNKAAIYRREWLGELDEEWLVPIE
jgi:hypothetical protein